jgi:hypothetical protein
MAADTKGLSQNLEGSKLRLFFQGGEISDVVLVSVNIHENCAFGDDHADFFYELMSTNRPDKYRSNEKKTPKPIYASDFKLLDRWEALDSMGGY